MSYNFKAEDFIPEILKERKYKKTYKYGGYTINGPDAPPLREFINFDKKQKDQYFTYTRKPKNWNKLPFKIKVEFAKRENERRRNGIFILINGYPLWIPGKHYHYLNYWTTENGTSPTFQLHDLLFYAWWETVVEADPNCYGGLDLKPRRIGDTEKALHILYEYGSRVRNTRIGMQNKIGQDAFDNYIRMLIGHQHMHEVFKPINKGSSDPQSGLMLKEPEERMTANKLNKNKGQSSTLFDNDPTSIKELGTRITYRPSIAKAYDSKRLHRFHLDEWGKMEKSEMSPVDCWGFVKPCLHKDNGVKIIGKAIFTTTAEEIESGESLEYALELWNGSNFEKKDDNGRTETGLYRIFRDAATCGASDEYGFPKIQANIDHIVNTITALEKAGKIEKAIAEKRKMPLKVEWALTPSTTRCRFDADILRANYQDITTHEDDLTVMGDLIWENGVQDSKVIWVPNPNGRICASQIPKDFGETNQYYFDGILKKPLNAHKGVVGCDTYDHIETNEDRRSLGALSSFRKYDINVDGIFPDLNSPDVDPFEFKTNQFTMTYVNRPENPDEFYEDAIKMCVFWGYPLFFENNKIGIRNYFNRRGYFGYLMLRPEETKAQNKMYKPEVGAASTTMFIGQYMEAISSWITKYGRLNKHLEIVKEWLIFQDKKRTLFDLTVSTGFSLVGKERRYVEINPEEEAKVQYFTGRNLYN